MRQRFLQSDPTDKYFEIKGLRLHYIDWGNFGAQPMVLIHGLQDCARSWDFFAAKMSSNYHVLALDQRGHGDSDWTTPDRYRLRDYVSDLAALVERLKLRTLVLVGHSAGGRNAFSYAIRHPDVVKSLVVVDIDLYAGTPISREVLRPSNNKSDEWESLEAVAELLRIRQPNSSDEMLIHQALHMTKNRPSGRRGWKHDLRLLESYDQTDLWNDWSEIMCETLILRGRQSDLIAHEAAVSMREAIPHGRLVELDGGGHWFYQEFPGAFEAAVRWFLDAPPD